MYMLILIMFRVNLLSTCLCNAHADHVSCKINEYLFMLMLFKV